MKTASRQFAFCFAISTVLLVPLKSVCEITNKTRTFDNSRHGCSITLPANWESMPDEKMAFLNDNAAKANPDWRKPALNHGCQQKDSQDLVFAPFIYIRVMELDREPTPEFVKTEMNKDRHDTAGVVMDDPMLDTKSEALVASGEVELDGRVPAISIVAIFPTRRSLIKTFCFASRVDAENHPELLRQMISGVRIYDDYKTASAKRSPTGLIVSIIAIGIMVLVMWKTKPAKLQTS